jgi:hypothetical protein
MMFEMRFVQDGKLALASYPPQWNDVVQDKLVIVQKENLEHTRFLPWWNDVV